MYNEFSLLIAYAYAMAHEGKDGDNMKPSKEMWVKQTKDIIDWVRSKKYDVVFETGQEDRVCFESKTIFINSKNHPETKYYTLLHEAGHLLVSQSWKTFDRDMPMYATSADGRHERSKAYMVSLLAEEIEAWKRGRRLSQKFKHFVDNEKFDSHITNNVMTYVVWAADCVRG